MFRKSQKEQNEGEGSRSADRRYRNAAANYAKSGAVTDVKEFPTRGHSLTIDSGWQEVADAVLDWLGKQQASATA